MFDEELRLLKSEQFNNGKIEEWEKSYRKIDALNLVLIDMENNRKVNEFLLQIEHDEAWFRW